MKFIFPRQIIGIFILLFGLSFLLCGQLAYAEAQMIGQMVWVKGSVKAVTEDKKERVLARRSPLFEKDTIVTDATGTGQIVFTDSSLVALRSDTTIKISEYKFNPSSPKDNKYVADLAKGGFRTITGLISKANPEGYEAKTPVATIGVRGTDFSIYYSDLTGMAVKLDLGSILVRNEGGELVLDKAKNYMYSEIRNAKEAPKLEKKPAAIFKTQPAIVQASAPGKHDDTGGAAGTTGNSSNKPPSGKTGTGGSKVVSSFCIS